MKATIEKERVLREWIVDVFPQFAVCEDCGCIADRIKELLVELPNGERKIIPVCVKCGSRNVKTTY